MVDVSTAGEPAGGSLRSWAGYAFAFRILEGIAVTGTVRLAPREARRSSGNGWAAPSISTGTASWSVARIASQRCARG